MEQGTKIQYHIYLYITYMLYIGLLSKITLMACKVDPTNQWKKVKIKDLRNIQYFFFLLLFICAFFLNETIMVTIRMFQVLRTQYNNNNIGLVPKICTSQFFLHFKSVPCVQGDFIVQFLDLCEKELSQPVDQVEPARLESLLGNQSFIS